MFILYNFNQRLGRVAKRLNVGQSAHTPVAFLFLEVECLFAI